jgi:hypothetical protein
VDTKQVITALFISMPIIFLSFFYLSYEIFQLLVEIEKLKQLRKDVESEKRFPKIKRKINKAVLRKKIKKGRFTSLIK